MKEIKHFNLKKFFSLFACLCLAFCLAFTVACDGGNNSSSSSSSSSDDDSTVSVTDYQSVKNGDFEFGTSSKSVTYPVYTGINWTKYRDNSYSTSAQSSTKNSGIIDTEADAYAKIAETNNFPKNDDDTYFNPKTPESYGLIDENTLYKYDEETYEDNPNEDKLCTSGTKILMIHNVTSTAGRGTAQKFVSSSSLTTTTGYGKISVWVLTKDLTSLQQGQPYGAYISVNNTLSSARSPFVVKNIDTKGVWANYVIYLETSDYAKSSYTLTVGLGFGSDSYKAEYVEGFAYFDNIHYEEIDEETFKTETATNDGKYSLFTDKGTEVDKDALKTNESGKTYLSNENKSATTVKYLYSHLMKSNELSLTYTGEYNKVYKHNPDAYAEGATSGIKAFNEIGIDGVTNPYGETAQTAYINLSKVSSYTLTSSVIEVNANTRMQFNFLTNVHVELQNQPGAKIDVEEVKDLDASEVLGTASVASNYNTYSTTDHANVWKKVSVFVENDQGATRYIRLKFTLGTTDNVFDAADYNLTKGYALFTGFNCRELPESEYDIVSSEADYKSTITLGYEYPNGPEEDEDETDNFAFTATTSTKTDLTYKPATGVQGYTGVVGNHTMVGGDKTAYSDANVISGIVSSKYVGNYSLSEEIKSSVSALKGDENIQPILINNVTSYCYGYLGSQLTMSKNTTTLVSVQVKVLGDATAYVYLANADPLSYFGVLEVASKPMVVKVTKDNAPSGEDKWVTVNFVITTGDQDLSYRVELWNGSRDGEVQSQGAVLYNTVSTSTSANVTNLKAKMQAEFVTNDSDVVETKYTRKPATVTYTDADGNDATYERTYTETVVCTEYKKGATIIASLETIDAPTEIDETTSTDDSDDDSSSSSTDDTTDDTAKANWALQLTSIIIAAVLVVVLAVVIIRLIVKKNKKAEIATGNFYNRNSREQAQAQINANKARRAKEAAEAKVQEKSDTADNKSDGDQTTENETEADNTEETAEEQSDEEKPYDYDNPENNL